MAHQRAPYSPALARSQVTTQGLVPRVGEAWLTRRSWLRRGRSIGLGLAGLAVGLGMLSEYATMARAPAAAGYAAFFFLATVMALGFLPCLVMMQGLNRRYYQWCPECLQAMTRGAHVCPCCGFRPGDGASENPTSRPA